MVGASCSNSTDVNDLSTVACLACYPWWRKNVKWVLATCSCLTCYLETPPPCEHASVQFSLLHARTLSCPDFHCHLSTTKHVLCAKYACAKHVLCALLMLCVDHVRRIVMCLVSNLCLAPNTCYSQSAACAACAQRANCFMHTAVAPRSPDILLVVAIALATCDLHHV